MPCRFQNRRPDVIHRHIQYGGSRNRDVESRRQAINQPVEMPIRDTNALGDVLLGDALRGQDGAQAIV